MIIFSKHNSFFKLFTIIGLVIFVIGCVNAINNENKPNENHQQIKTPFSILYSIFRLILEFLIKAKRKILFQQGYLTENLQQIKQNARKNINQNAKSEHHTLKTDKSSARFDEKSRRIDKIESHLNEKNKILDSKPLNSEFHTSKTQENKESNESPSQKDYQKTTTNHNAFHNEEKNIKPPPASPSPSVPASKPQQSIPIQTKTKLNVEEDFNKELIDNLPEKTPEPFILKSNTQPVAEEKTMDAEELLNRLHYLDKSITDYLSEESSILDKLKSRSDIFTMDIPIPSYLYQIQGNQTSGRINRDNKGITKNFYKFKENISLPKNLPNANGWTINYSSATFYVKPVEKLDWVSKIVFEGLWENCMAKDIYTIVTLENGVSVACGVNTLQIGEKQTIYLPYEMLFKEIRFVILTNHGDPDKVCLSDFQLYRKVHTSDFS